MLVAKATMEQSVKGFRALRTTHSVHTYGLNRTQLKISRWIVWLAWHMSCLSAS